MSIPITYAEGDGIGPEIMAATLRILEASKVPLDLKEVIIGEKVYLKGFKAGIEPSSWDAIRKSKAFLKAPITTPQGGGFKSLNVTIRTSLGLYANVRPCVAYNPYVDTVHPDMDVVIIRENEEDLYCGVEYRQTDETYHAIKIISRPGSEKIIRYAFEYARANGRKKVTCFIKDNILKLTDGEFHRVFNAIAPEYPEIENESWIVDIGAAKLADTPKVFDVLVMPNLYGDILSDVAAQIAGSVGLAGSANIGTGGAMFEAIHGSAPRRANQNLANPSGLILASVMMLQHVGKPNDASLVHNAWLKTIEDGIHTYDIFQEGLSKKKVGTKEFADAVIQRLGQTPENLKKAHHGEQKKTELKQENAQAKAKKELLGVDIYVDFKGHPNDLAKKLTNTPLKLFHIFNRGVKVWPETPPEVGLIDSFRARFFDPERKIITSKQIIETLAKLDQVEVIKTENLYQFDGKPGFTLSQDEQ